jgi:hypothetical protein
MRVCRRVFAAGWLEKALELGQYFDEDDDDEALPEDDGDRGG